MSNTNIAEYLAIEAWNGSDVALEQPKSVDPSDLLEAPLAGGWSGWLEAFESAMLVESYGAAASSHPHSMEFNVEQTSLTDIDDGFELDPTPGKTAQESELSTVASPSAPQMPIGTAAIRGGGETSFWTEYVGDSAGPNSSNTSYMLTAHDLMHFDVESLGREGRWDTRDSLNANGGFGETGAETGVLSEYTSGDDPSGYNIEIHFKGTWSVDLQQAFIDSAEYLSSVILGDLPDVFYRGRIIDDLRIDAKLTDIDGAGGILGQAGPTAVRIVDFLPATAVMEFDSADADAFNELGLWDEIVLHEMIHSVGFGALWSYKGLISGAGTDTPLFTGERALATYEVWSGDADAAGVPVEQDGGPGTRDAHWDEEVFDAELMTGYLDSAGNYVSNITIASLEDLGYDTTWEAPLDEFAIA